MTALDHRPGVGEGEAPAPGRPQLVLTVHGVPAPQGSKHGRPIYNGRGANKVFTGKVAQVESSVNLPAWREAVKEQALKGRERLGAPLLGPVFVEATFSFNRPKYHWRTGRNAHLLRDSAPARPTGPPDLSKLVRAIEDALTDAGVWRDDAQAVEEHTRKVYVDTGIDALPHPGAVIRIHPIGATP